MGFQNLVLIIFIVPLVVAQQGNCKVTSGSHHDHKKVHNGSTSFVRRNGTRFVLNQRPYCLNGFNAYWLMYMSSHPSTRTFAFNDGGYRTLQISPAHYDENVFKGLDFVISEAGKYGVRLIVSLVNNWNESGGKDRYVQWARERGQHVTNDDDFFTHPVVKQYYKNHVKVWVSEMATYVKSIDSNHLLEVGLEGFYGESMPEKKQFNPGFQVGTDFISNNQVPQIDFATIHLYPDQW
ncbi:hypothetical protein VNO77_13782 [Canavalia gladiata]|uniref:mannan endo-1,4-beta-mannosidase n=1 Tax=Canavalia gladiata TaxID=3824 RepID=A0AAN9M1A3_CANGL